MEQPGYPRPNLPIWKGTNQPWGYFQPFPAVGFGFFVFAGLRKHIYINDCHILCQLLTLLLARLGHVFHFWRPQTGADPGGAARYANSFTRPGPSWSTMGAQCCPGVSLWAKVPPAPSWEQSSGKINDEIHSAGPSLPVPGRSARRSQTLGSAKTLTKTHVERHFCLRYSSY